MNGLGALSSGLEYFQALIHGLEICCRVIAEPFELFVNVRNAFGQLLHLIIHRFKTYVDVAPKFVKAPVDRIKAPVDRGEQILIRHKLTLPRLRPAVKKLFPV